MSKSLVVFGSSAARPGTAQWEQAVEVGRIAAANGYELVSGGYQGAMEAASRGAHEAGGRVVGITTRIFADREPSSVLDEIREEADYPARLAALLRAGDAFVALPGGLGTASEWMAACCLASIGQLGGPLYAFVDPWRPLARALAAVDEIGELALQLPAWLEDASALATRL